MKVADLIEILETMNPKAIIVLSRDSEGNEFSTLDDYEEGYFNSKTSEFVSEEEAFETRDDYDDLDDDYEDETREPKNIGVEAVVFWPAY